MLKNKLIYAFGDSIIYGHTAPEKSFMKMLSSEEGFRLGMYAVNGATVMKGENDIITQIENAPKEKPDGIIFDGYTNDAYERNMGSVGEFTESLTADFDETTFCGGFDKIISMMKDKWPGVRIIYVTIHRSAGRDFMIQLKLREIALWICEKWNIEVLDIFARAELDTRDKEQMDRYIMGQAGSHPNEEACRKYYMPLMKKKLIEVFEK